MHGCRASQSEAKRQGSAGRSSAASAERAAGRLAGRAALAHRKSKARAGFAMRAKDLANWFGMAASSGRCWLSLGRRTEGTGIDTGRRGPALQNDGLRGRLFVAESVYGIQSGGAGSGYPAGRQGDEEKYRENGDVGQRVGRAGAVKHAGHDAGEQQSDSDANGSADGGHHSSLSQHHAEDLASLGAHSDANADFPRALPGEIRDHAVDAHAGEEQSKPGEDREKNHGEAAVGEGTGDHLVHGLRAVDDLIDAHLTAGAANGFENGDGTLRAGQHA